MIVHSNGRVDRHCVGLVGQRCSHSLSLLVGRLGIRYALPLHTSLEVIPFVVDSCQIAIVSGITALGVVLRLLIVMSMIVAMPTTIKDYNENDDAGDDDDDAGQR